MPILRQSTAITIAIGPFLSETSGTTLMTAIEVSVATGIDLIKGSAKLDITTSVAGTNAMAHVANGWYSLALAQSQMTTLGPLVVTANFTGCLPVWHQYDTIEEVEWDRIFAAGATVTDVKTDTTSIAINVTAGFVSTMIGISSVLSNILALRADHVSLMIDVDSLLANVSLWGTSTMIGVASLLANQVLWGNSSGIAVRSIASNLATMQIENTSILSNVKTGVVSIMIGVASVLSNVAGVLASEVSIMSAIGVLNDISTADVNAEIVDALMVDTYGEPGIGAPALSLPIGTKIGYLYKNWRNKKYVDSTEIKFYGDDDLTVDQKTAHDDTGVYVKDKIISGP